MTAEGAVPPPPVEAIDGESARIQSLIAEVDSLCTDDRWDDVLELRDRCKLAVARGHQWWPAAAWAEYRVALDGPGPLAASVLESNLSRYTLGPFAEVAASTHSWEELRPYLERSPASSLFAFECIALGDDLRADDVFRGLPPVFDAPSWREPWEPNYGPVTYHLDRVEHLAPILPTPGVFSSGAFSAGGTAERPVSGSVSAERVEDPDTCEALTALVSPWSDSLAWTVDSAAFEGSPAESVNAWPSGQLGGLTSVPSPDALRYLAWLAASGGPVGRRRGLASARSAVWWVLLQLSGLVDDLDGEPVESAGQAFFEALGAAVGSLNWFTWPAAARGAGSEALANAPSAQSGWGVHLAVESPAEQMSWLLNVDPSPKR